MSVEVSIGGMKTWHTLSFEASLRADASRYTSRNAIDENNLLTNALLHVVDLAVYLRGDWTLSHRLFFVFECCGNYTVSNSPLYEGWSIQASAGIDLSF